jgi:hypothetical protein
MGLGQLTPAYNVLQLVVPYATCYTSRRTMGWGWGIRAAAGLALSSMKIAEDGWPLCFSIWAVRLVIFPCLIKIFGRPTDHNDIHSDNTVKSTQALLLFLRFLTCLVERSIIYFWDLSLGRVSFGVSAQNEDDEPFLPEFQAAAKKCNYVKVCRK